MTIVSMPISSVRAVSRTPAPLKAISVIGSITPHARPAGFISVSKLKDPEVATAAKSVMPSSGF